MPQYCDAYGRPDPDGKFEIVPRKKPLKDGERVGFELAFMEGAAPRPKGSNMPTSADAAVAYARMVYDKQHAYLGDKAPAFTDAMERQVRDAASAQPQPGRRSRHVVTTDAEVDAAYRGMMENYARGPKDRYAR